jgi:hypothetical protein
VLIRYIIVIFLKLDASILYSFFLVKELELKTNNVTSENISKYIREKRINENPNTIEDLSY